MIQEHPSPKSKERERGGGGKYVHQEGTAADPEEKVLMSFLFFFYLHVSCCHYDLNAPQIPNSQELRGECPEPAGNLDFPQTPHQYSALLYNKFLNPRLIYLPPPNNPISCAH